MFLLVVKFIYFLQGCEIKFWAGKTWVQGYPAAFLPRSSVGKSLESLELGWVKVRVNVRVRIRVGLGVGLS